MTAGGYGGSPPRAGAGTGIPCMQMRGGTSRGLYFVAADLPSDPAERDELLIAIMGSGHPLQI
ncbi:MAG: hypothetical protein J2P28_11005, partial [Actinobacteria bacterium]|nr:hypothetical protein [Actinomycetota bacterium]